MSGCRGRGGPERRRRPRRGVHRRAAAPPRGAITRRRRGAGSPGGPGVGRRLPRGGVAGPGEAAAFGVPARPRGRNRRHVRVVGERGAAHPVHPRDQVVGGVQRGPRRGLVAARPALLGQVGAGAHAHDQQPPALDRPVRDWYLASASRTSARPSAGRPAHTATSAARCAISRASSMLPIRPMTDLICCSRPAAAATSPRSRSISARSPCTG